MFKKTILITFVLMICLAATVGADGSVISFDEPMVITFEDLDFNTLFSEEYAHAPGNPEEPLFVMLSGWTGTDIADGILNMQNGSRWGLGMPLEYQEERTSLWDIETMGCLDLSKPYVVTVEFDEIEPQERGIFQVFVDNNTVGQIESIHGMESELFVKDAVDIESNEVVVIESDIGSETSFLTFRASGGTNLNIKRITIAYQ